MLRESAMAPRTGGAAVAIHHGMHAQLISLSIAIGLSLSFITLLLRPRAFTALWQRGGLTVIRAAPGVLVAVVSALAGSRG